MVANKKPAKKVKKVSRKIRERIADLPMKFNSHMKYEPDVEKMKEKISEEELKKKLTKEEYDVLRKKGTERAFTGKLLHNKKTGVYTCKVCGSPLFKSEAKFDSGTGWPSFSDVIKENVELERDFSLGLPRTEVICKKCGSHLGHVFNDGPGPVGKRYCINSAALGFKESKNLDPNSRKKK